MQREVIEGPVDILRTMVRIADARNDEPSDTRQALLAQIVCMGESEGKTIADALAYLEMAASLHYASRNHAGTFDGEMFFEAAMRMEVLASRVLEALAGASAEDLVYGPARKAAN